MHPIFCRFNHVLVSGVSFPVHEIQAISDMDLESKYCYVYHSWDFVPMGIKDFNAETNTSLKLNLFSFFICSCQHHQRKTICLYVYISDIRQIVGYRTPVFIQRFPWHHHITITYNLPHLRL